MRKTLLFALVCLGTLGCNSSDVTVYRKYNYRKPFFKKITLLLGDIELFKDSRAWELAKAVYEQDTAGIVTIARKDPSLLRFQTKRFGVTVLRWAIANDRYYSAKALLQAGADPNIISDDDGMTPFKDAAANEATPAYLKLILDFGFDPNSKVYNKQSQCRTVLEAAACHSLTNVKMLVDRGVNVTDSSERSLFTAVLYEKIDIVKYLIFECHVDFTRPMPYFHSPDHPETDKITYIYVYITYMRFKKHSTEDKMRDEVIDYMIKHGYDTVKMY